MVNYLTPSAYQRMRKELFQLLDVDRPETVNAVSEAAAQGDRSENAEYIYGKKRLREIDRRIRFLQKRLEHVEVIDPQKLDTQQMRFGLCMRVQNDEGVEKVLQLVGPDEIDPNLGKITFSSPLGKAALGKEVGDAFTIQGPQGPIEYEILEIFRPSISEELSSVES